jgi:hypothetical protein
MTFFNTSRTRREFVRQIAAGVVAVEVVPVAVARTGAGSNATPGVSFFLDQPYWDATGMDRTYRPPQGMRSGQSLAELTEEELRTRFGWL